MALTTKLISSLFWTVTVCDWSKGGSWSESMCGSGIVLDSSFSDIEIIYEVQVSATNSMFLAFFRLLDSHKNLSGRSFFESYILVVDRSHKFTIL